MNNFNRFSQWSQPSYWNEPASPVYPPTRYDNRPWPWPSSTAHLADATPVIPPVPPEMDNYLGYRSPYIEDGLPPLIDAPAAGFHSWPQAYFDQFAPDPLLLTPGTPAAKLRPVIVADRATFDPDFLAARPADWRPDYKPPRRFRLPSVFGGKSSSKKQTKTRLTPTSLTPTLLMPNRKVPVITFDLRSDDPFDNSNLELLSTGGRLFNPTDLAQIATTGTRHVNHLRFYHPRLPWFIDVRASQANGILVGNVLHQIHMKLHRPIHAHDFSNTELNAADREAITSAYRDRCADRADIMQQGVRKVDFLGDDCILLGFIPGKDGMWLMKTRRINSW
ncbi:hypothetical protein R3P38DRAFT_168968 [Favolaschia claudopus]|uniref:DUF6699 domain-containing protein n=1 Tax=Favolaschia claudopus TaxID=2862362 RepID=A0AAW0D188_9AGAR